MAPHHLRSIREYEKLHDRYLASPNKKDLLIKKMYALETYIIYAHGDYILMVTINHNRTSKDIGEICNNLIEDAKIDGESCFIFKYY